MWKVLIIHFYLHAKNFVYMYYLEALWVKNHIYISNSYYSFSLKRLLMLLRCHYEITKISRLHRCVRGNKPKASIVVDGTNGQILWKRNADVAVGPRIQNGWHLLMRKNTYH